MYTVETFKEPLSEDERILHIKDMQDMPARYHLIDVLKNIKSGRPAASQKYIDKCIKELQFMPKMGEPFT